VRERAGGDGQVHGARAGAPRGPGPGAPMTRDGVAPPPDAGAPAATGSGAGVAGWRTIETRRIATATWWRMNPRSSS